MADEIKRDGSFERQGNYFTTPFGSGPGKLPVQAGRYRLLWTPVCPWAHRAIIARKILGLEEAISVGTLDPIRPNKPYNDWAFTLDPGGVDPVLKVPYISDIYYRTDPDYPGRVTVPAVVDLTTGKIVNNDYFRLSNYFEVQWKPFHKKDAPDLYPEDLRKDIDELNDILFHKVNNGVYKAGFAKSQAAYEKAYDEVFEELDKLELRLAHQRYLFGNQLTDSDIRLYVTLARFDVAYYNKFNVNRNRLIDFKNLWRYAKDLYHTPGFGDTTDFDAIKRHYHLSRLISDSENKFAVLPKGPDLSVWK
jgi:putative glutathione S-transferase